MVEKYKAEFGDMIRLLRGDVTIALGRKTQMDISDVAETLNQETAPLHAEIERLKAELAEAQKFIRDVASRDLDISEGYRHVSYNAIVIEAKKQVASWDSTPQDIEDAQESETDNEA